MSRGLSDSKAAAVGDAIDTVVFDLGGVLVDWNPRYLYRKLILDEREMERFLADVCNGPWNEQQDGGRPFAVATAELVAKHPDKREWIEAFFARWGEMVSGPIAGTAAILERLHGNRRHRLFALSNWSAETYPLVRPRLAFLGFFEKVLLSGEEKLMKPDPRFFALLTERHGVDPRRAIFIDDVEKNIEAAKRLGFRTHHFRNAEELGRELARLGMLEEK